MAKQININHLRINDERIKQYVDTETAKAGKHEIVNSAGTALPPEPNIRFNGLDATDNAQDATSEISAKGLNADDLAEIVSTTPANYAVGNTAMYSTTEQIVGRWIDGKPLYQKTYALPISASAASQSERAVASADVASLTIDTITDLAGMVKSNNSNQFPLEYAVGSGQYIRASLDGANNALRIYATAAFSATATAYVTIQYTKTGD